jgi:hypothetical protein
MIKVIDFGSFSRIFESSTSGSSIIIGDSLTPLIDKHIKNASVISSKQGQESLWKGGVGVSWLKKAIESYPVSPGIQNVIISIGTNGGFSQRDDIKGLFRSLKSKFPKAKFIVVKGSWGWGGNKGITSSQVDKYYQKFSDEGGIIIETPIGFSPTDSDAHSDRPVLSQIGKIIDGLIPKTTQTQSSFQVAKTSVEEPIVQSETGIIYRPGDVFRYKVVNDHWLAKKDSQTKWFEITGADFKPSFQSSIDLLDSENPQARSSNAPKRTVPGGSKVTKTSPKKTETEPSKSGYDAILVGGLDYRPSDYKLDRQVDLLKKGFGTNKKIMAFRYSTPASTVLDFLKKNPYLPIFLFSAGCQLSDTLSKSPDADPKKIYVIEPFGSSEKTASIVRAAVQNGLPAQNVFVGKSQSTGAGIVRGSSRSGSSTHWGALTQVGSYKRSGEEETMPQQKAGANPETTDPDISEEFNFHLVPDGRGTNYRGAQFPLDVMEQMYKKYKIKNVIRFNGDGNDGRHKKKYASVSIAEEEALAKKLGINFYKMSSTRNQKEVNDLLKQGNTLVHCAHGADRTGGNVGGYLYSEKPNTQLQSTNQIWNYTTKYNGWNSMSLKSPKSFSEGGYLKQAQKFGVRDLQHAQELAKK